MLRRRLLHVGIALVAPVAGCLGRRGGPLREAGGGGGGEGTTAPEPRGPVRGESDADLDVRSVEDDPDVEYRPEEGVVRYVAAWRHANEEAVENGSEAPTREPVYETAPFEEWAGTRCISVAARAAAEHASEQLGTTAVGGGVSNAVDGEDLAAVVSVSSVLDREGNVVSGTDVDFEALVAETPATVTTTYVLAGREHEVDVPAYAQHRVLKQQ